MSVILLLLAASLSIALCFLLAFIWSVKSGQYDDDYTPSVRMLFDDEQPQQKTNSSTSDPATNQNKIDTYGNRKVSV